jgi:hypothetical protein
MIKLFLFLSAITFAISPLILLPFAVIPFIKKKDKDKKTEDKKDDGKTSLLKKVKEKVKQKKFAETLKLTNIKIKKKNLYLYFTSAQDLNVDLLKVEFLDKEKNLLDTLEKKNFNVRANTKFMVVFPIKLEKLKLVKTKFLRITIISDKVKTTTTKKFTFFSLI